eukprot:CAMPEP_0113512596 /NCGR_PEP_ID=MMETSP0014_2-20120614/39420_1 /TAXON_ID=2857 /ORGANISM="Nitzschia sp." /LENGTH=509 /DNA_ID=CAMNT_0000408957 /DNA_START=51 /DNA_END=1580 /DNA_ORIENTATION=- /assembly_acc=CAM_ASM_000159
MEDYPSGQGSGGGTGTGTGTGEGPGRGNRQQATNDKEISNKRLKTMDQQHLSRLDPSMMPVPLPQPNPLPNMSPNAQLPIPGAGVGVHSSSNTVGLDLASVLNNQQQRSISLPHQASTTTQSPLQDGRSPSLTSAATTGAASSSTDHNSSQQFAAFSPLNTSQHNFLNFSSPQFQQHQIQSFLAQQATLLQMQQQQQQQQELQQQGQGQRGPSSQPVPFGAGPGSINNAAMLQYMVQQNQALMAALATQQHDPNSIPMTTASVASPSVPSAWLGQQHQHQLPSLQAQLAMLRNPQIGGSTQPATMTPNTMIPQSGTGNSRVATSSTPRDGSHSVAADGTATTGPDNVNNPSTDVAANKQRPMSGRRPSLLFMPCDHDSLSEYQCLVRKQIEIFEATQQDVESSAKGRNRPIVLGQVGIRCRHCTALLPKNRTRGATYFPAKLSGLYQAAQSMASGHLCGHCGHIPKDLREELLVLRERKSSAGGGKKYWADGLQVLGVIEDENGLRFKS